jgi:multiple sugar transport system permease protein
MVALQATNTEGTTAPNKAAQSVKLKKPPKYSRGQRREHRAAFLFISPWLIGFLVFTLGAMIYSLVLSFSHYDLGTNSITSAGVTNYQQLLEDPKVLQALGNTLFYAVLAVPGEMIVALVLALLLNSVKRFAGVFRVLYYLPKMTPAVATAAIFLVLLNGNQGGINKFLALFGIEGPQWLIAPGWVIVSIVLMTLWGVGGTMVILLAALKNVPIDLYEASALDGAGIVRQFFRITLPMVSNALFFNVIVLTIAALQVFDQVYLLFYQNAQASAPSSSLFIAVYLFQQAFQQFNLGFAAAISWLVFVIVMVITVIQVKYGNRFVYYEGE